MDDKGLDFQDQYDFFIHHVESCAVKQILPVHILGDLASRNESMNCLDTLKKDCLNKGILLKEMSIIDVPSVGTWSFFYYPPNSTLVTRFLNRGRNQEFSIHRFEGVLNPINFITPPSELTSQLVQENAKDW